LVTEHIAQLRRVTPRAPGSTVAHFTLRLLTVVEVEAEDNAGLTSRDTHGEGTAHATMSLDASEEQRGREFTARARLVGHYAEYFGDTAQEYSPVSPIDGLPEFIVVEHGPCRVDRTGPMRPRG
jgi:hypothetical protein